MDDLPTLSVAALVLGVWGQVNGPRGVLAQGRVDSCSTR